MKNILLTLLLLSPLAFAEDETFICDCNSHIYSKDNLVRSCPGYPKKLYGLIINSEEKTISFQDEKYYYKSNPNTLTGRLFHTKRDADGEIIQDREIEIEFEKVTKALTWKLTDFVGELPNVTQIYSCESP